MTTEQKAARLQLIKQIAEKQNRRKAFAAKIKAKNSAARAAAERRETKNNKEFNSLVEKMDENYNRWTDEAKYADQYYGDVYRETTKFDNDWN